MTCENFSNTCDSYYCVYIYILYVVYQHNFFENGTIIYIYIYDDSLRSNEKPDAGASAGGFSG